MRVSFLSYLRPLLVTILLLILCEVLSTTLLPLMGLQSYRIPFNILIVLYFGFKVNSPFTAVMILIVQYFHSFFSIEGWELGTIAGIMIYILMGLLRDLIHFNSAVVTILVTQIFQVAWFIIVSGILYIKYDNLDYIISKFWRFLPESIVLSLLAPFVFFLLDTIWTIKESRSLGDRA